MPEMVEAGGRFAVFPYFNYLTPPRQEVEQEREQRQEMRQDRLVEQNDQAQRFTPDMRPIQPRAEASEQAPEQHEEPEDSARPIASPAFFEGQEQENRARFMDRYA